MIKTHIKTFEQLITYFEQPQVTVAEMGKILSEAKIAWLIDDEPKEVVLGKLKIYWKKWGNVKKVERPIFLMCDDPLDISQQKQKHILN